MMHNTQVSRSVRMSIPWILVVLILGCAASPDVDRKVDLTVRQLLTPRQHLPAPANGPAFGIPVAPLSFSDLFYRAVANSPELSMAELHESIGALYVEQGRSYKWPRVDIELTAEAPIGEKDIEASDIFGGGLFIKYDLNRLIFIKDHIAIARLKQQQGLEEKLLARRNLLFQLYDLANEISFQEHLAPEYESILAAINEELLLLTDGTEEMNPLDRKDRIRYLQNQQLVYTYKETACRWRLRLLRWDLIQRIGLNQMTEINVSDLESIVALPDDVKLNVAIESMAAPDIASLWQRRREARVAEASLFLAEMNIIETGRERLPKFSAAVGIGWIDLNKDENEAGVKPFIRATTPLLDMGDIRRKIRYAEKKRDIEKEKITALARRMALEHHEALAAADLARTRYIDRRRQADQAVTDAESIKRLCAIGRAKPARRCEALQNAIAMRIQLLESLFGYRRDQMRLHKNAGTLPEVLSHLVDVDNSNPEDRHTHP